MWDCLNVICFAQRARKRLEANIEAIAVCLIYVDQRQTSHTNVAHAPRIRHTSMGGQLGLMMLLNARSIW